MIHQAFRQKIKEKALTAEKTVVFGEAAARWMSSNGWHKYDGCDLHLKNEVLAKCILKRSKLLRLPVQPFLAVCVTHRRVFTGIQHSQSLSWPKLTVKLAPVWLRNWFWALCVSVCVRLVSPWCSSSKAVQVCLCCSRMGLQDKQQVVPVSSDNSWVLCVDTGLQEEERPAQYPSTLNPTSPTQNPYIYGQLMCMNITKRI